MRNKLFKIVLLPLGLPILVAAGLVGLTAMGFLCLIVRCGDSFF